MTDNDTPAYEGRTLPRPHEDLYDQGLAFDLVTMSRRRMLGSLGLGAGMLALAACGADGASGSSATSAQASAAATTADGEIPDETAGPYPGDGSNGPNVLTESGVVREDIRSSFGSASGTAAGIPMTITLSITDYSQSQAPYAGVAVYVWHCDRAGNYSLYSDGITDQNYLRGVQIAGADGSVTFTSIFPACYSGRWPHIHFEVYPDEASISDASNAIATSQIALPQETCAAVYATAGYEQSVTNLSQITLATDNVFGNDDAALQMATVTGATTNGYTVSLVAAVDPATTPTGGDAPGAPGGGAPGAATGTPAAARPTPTGPRPTSA
ncbi:protocatechuate 3,4-dioxygenase beta subunit [Kineosphaera limosa]|uniref:Putative dioxygenase n=1 Tax=Kineosphaera limosa NBRC 100340 TaxID=1184609 RepID=K6WLL2_9MICO|nr:3,4-dioxygenase subunit beta [Kineosphaera limosa]NYD99347.1 protocatechuate 3,4-dioxygenase beta subunit [Kineosphaera limosa]GAB94696.1 putative dioxygenase [Kineosphaera limosa NBRC 100340]